MLSSFRIAAFVGVLGVVAGMVACSAEGSLEPLGVEAAALEDPIRTTLTACTANNTCGTGRSCCAGYCAKTYDPNTKLAALSGENLEYMCHSGNGTAAANILPDFSWAGYKKGGVAFPTVSPYGPIYPGGGTWPSCRGDDACTINKAIQEAGDLAQTSGVTYAVLLGEGVFVLTAPILLNRDRVVLKGVGQGAGQTLLKSVISSAHDLIQISKPHERIVAEGPSVKLSSTVRVGATRLVVDSIPSSFAAGDDIYVRRAPTQAWLTKVGAPLKWTTAKPVYRHIRRIVDLNRNTNTITIDIPMVDSIHENDRSSPDYYGGGRVEEIPLGGYVDGVGVEDLRIDTQTVDTATDDEAWNAVKLARATNSWVRRVTVLHYGMSAVAIGDESRFNTIEEVAHLDPKSPLEAPCQLPVSGHRYSFYVSGESYGNLFQRCYSRDSRHSFVSGIRGVGPNVWLDCLAVEQNADSGPHKEWNTGMLFDNVRATWSEEAEDCDEQPNWNYGLSAQYAGNHGWRGAHVMFWNTNGTVASTAPPTATNWVVGGVVTDAPQVRPGDPKGIWQFTDTVVKPRSLYLQQLYDRRGSAAVNTVTIPEQRTGLTSNAGRLFDALNAWAGQGKLADYFADPTCENGRTVSPGSGPTCCASSCQQCGNSGCTGDCCTQAIAQLGRSCAHYPAPCVMPDPTCAWGETVTPVQNGPTYCCPTGSNCAAAAAGRSCIEYPEPCIMNSDVNCVTGVPGSGACCGAGCNQCGHPGCGATANPVGECCIGTIQQNEGPCSGSMPPCEMP